MKHKLGKNALTVVALFSATAFAQLSSRVFDHEVELVGMVAGATASNGCSVELRDPQGYEVAEQTMCDRSGGFDFPQVPRGTYKLVVKMGSDEYTEEVNLEAPREQVEIQMPSRRPVEESSNTVSVAEMRIPEKAKDELHKADTELSKGKLDKADEYAQKALATDPQYARAMTLRAVIMMSKNDFNSALQLTDSSAKLDPMLALTQVVRASALNDVGRAKEAQAAAEQGLRLDGSWQARFELARALMTQRLFKEALGEIDKAMAAAPPQFGELLLLRASALMNLMDISDAKETLAAFIKERPGDPRGTQLLAKLNAK